MKNYKKVAHFEGGGAVPDSVYGHFSAYAQGKKKSRDLRKALSAEGYSIEGRVNSNRTGVEVRDKAGNITFIRNGDF
jgi:hypothetical protein